MPNALVVVLCAVAAASFWTVLGFALARRLVGPALALPIAPALGWAVHSAAALPILLLAGFSITTVAIVSAAALAASFVALLAQRSRHDNPPSPSVPVWAYLGAAVLALAAAVAIMPKVGIDGVAFAPPIFDHSKATLIDEMTRLRLPPGNPFFGAVGEPASRLAYYYLWHFSAAELALLTGASGWEADIAMTWFTAFSSLALMLGLANWFGGRATALLWVLLLNAALSCRVVLAGLFGTEAVHQVLMPATGFGGWLFQAAWVPQHIAAASAVILALFFLGRLAVERSPLLLATLVLLAVAGYESSTWIGGVLFPVAAAMTGGMLSDRGCAASADELAVLVHRGRDPGDLSGLAAAARPVPGDWNAGRRLADHVPSLPGPGNRLSRWVAPYFGCTGVLAASLADRISRRLRHRRRFVVGLSATAQSGRRRR